MIFFKPTWINHEGMLLFPNYPIIQFLYYIEGKPIFSVDIHPNGGRFATGGQGGSGGRIVIWNIGPVLDENEETNPKIPKMLCQMDNHLGKLHFKLLYHNYARNDLLKLTEE